MPKDSQESAFPRQRITFVLTYHKLEEMITSNDFQPSKAGGRVVGERSDSEVTEERCTGLPGGCDQVNGGFLPVT